MSRSTTSQQQQQLAPIPDGPEFEKPLVSCRRHVVLRQLFPTLPDFASFAEDGRRQEEGRSGRSVNSMCVQLVNWSSSMRMINELLESSTVVGNISI